jgi:hypothetical protein
MPLSLKTLVKVETNDSSTYMTWRELLALLPHDVNSNLITQWAATGAAMHNNIAYTLTGEGQDTVTHNGTWRNPIQGAKGLAAARQMLRRHCVT